MGGAAAAAGEAAGAAGATALTVDKAVLNIFWELASVQASKREVGGRRVAACGHACQVSRANAARRRRPSSSSSR
jgi:hypothetical protein